MEKDKPIIILGEEIRKEYLPKLYEWAKSNPATLAEQLKSVADAWHKGNIGMAMVSLETDL